VAGHNDLSVLEAIGSKMYRAVWTLCDVIYSTWSTVLYVRYENLFNRKNGETDVYNK